MSESAGRLEYVGFWIRVAASLIDTVLFSLFLWPLGHLLYRTTQQTSPGWDPNPLGQLDLSQLQQQLQQQLHFTASDWFLDLILPAAVVILFWKARQATPGKMAFGARVVDATTGLPITVGQSCIRYLGYYVSAVFLCLGFIWVGIDQRKQGWHDKMANTIVVRRRIAPPEPPGS